MRTAAQSWPPSCGTGLCYLQCTPTCPSGNILARWPGAKAQLPCGYCRIQGTLHGRQYVPQGYTVAVKHDLLVSPTRTLMARCRRTVDR